MGRGQISPNPGTFIKVLGYFANSRTFLYLL
jgi:hypothetical protein